MDVLNISIDDNEQDTSHDEQDEDPDFNACFLSKPTRSRLIDREGISHFGEFAERFKAWERPPVPEGTLLYSQSPLDPQPEPFHFLFLDSVSSVSSIKHERIELSPLLHNAPLHTVMRLFGVVRVPLCSSEDVFEEPDVRNPDNFAKTHTFSICCNVHGFIPYFYALPTAGFFASNGSSFDEVTEKLCKDLNKKACEAILNNFSMVGVHDFITSGESPVVVQIEGLQIQAVENSVFQFSPSKKKHKNSLVLKVYVALPMFVTETARVLQSFTDPCEFETFETCLTNNIRFLADQDIPGCTWLELKAGAYFERTAPAHNFSERESHCQIELDVHYRDIAKLSNPPLDIPPLRVLSFDLETRVINTRPQAGPSNSRGQILQVGAVLSSYGVKDNPIIGKVAFVLGTCDNLPDAKVLPFFDKRDPENCSFESLEKPEALMLSSFRDFVIQMDPDIITGYNIKNFDFPYLIRRGEYFYHDFKDIARFSFLGRLKKVSASLREVINKNKKMFNFDNQILNVQGRIVMDMYPLMRRHTTGNGNGGLKLKTVAQKYLSAGEEKDDVKYTEINALQDGTSTTRKRLAKYCVQDAYLPVKLMLIQMPDRNAFKQNFLEYYFENSRLGGTLLRYLVNKSREYNKYFKQVRVQKNGGRVKYYPDSPNAKSLNKILNRPRGGYVSTANISTTRKLKSSRMLFTDEND